VVEESESGLGQQASADAVSLQVISDVQIVEKGTPRRIVVENGMGETDDFTTIVSHDGELVQPGRSEATGPDLMTISDDVTVEVGIQIRAAIMATPAVSVECSDVAGILLRRLSIRHNGGRPVSVVPGLSHGTLLIDPGIGTVPKSAAGPSQGQVPQVTLDERTSEYRNRRCRSYMTMGR
jgi:hypothetical protein